jgi:ABC-type multidrug transport system permease subunit
VAAAVLSAALLSVSGDGGESTPAWWNEVALIAPGALLLTGLLLMVSKAWRRFGAGFAAGVLAVFGVVIAFLTWFLFYTLV